MHPKLWLAGKAATIAGSLVTERVRDTTPRTRADIPADGEDLTVEWLTDILCDGHPGARVTAFETEAGTSQTTKRAGLTVTYNDAGVAAGLPEHLFTKTTTGFRQRLVLGGAHMLHGETQFYTVFRPEIEMEAPLGYWGGVDERSWRSMIVMEDIAATRGATFIEPTTPLTRTQVEEVIANLAACHGAWWNRREALSIVKSPDDHFNNVSSFIDMGKRCEVGIEKAKDVVPDSVRGESARLWKGTQRQLHLLTTEHPPTLLHGDTHVGQAYVTGDGRMGLSDWQSIIAGGWGYDFGYFVGSACDPEDRRAWEKELLELYLEKLGEAGGEPPAFDDAWLVYRQNVCYACTAWSFAYGRAFYQPEMQPDATCREVIRRLSHAVSDLETFKALGV